MSDDFDPAQDARDSYDVAIAEMRARHVAKRDVRSRYMEFLASKAPRPQATGIEPAALPSHLFDFQAACVDFALRQGRAGIYLDTGLGKTAVQLEWCRQAAEATTGRALLLTPLAVARQIEREGQRFGYECRVIRDMEEVGPGINICNYDRLDRLQPDAFGAVSLDEASIIKNFMGATNRSLSDAFGGHRFRLCATATPAPNDHMELGQQASFLGVMSSAEMLSRFFINDTAKASQQWRLKGHAQQAFWDWMASWSRMAQSPEDLGFDGSRFFLPPLRIVKHKAQASVKRSDGGLFALDVSATTMHDLKRQTAEVRAGVVADLVNGSPEAWVIWCDTDAEADCLVSRIPDAVEVRGSMPVERKEKTLAAFGEGQARVIITKASIAGYGLNWQHCARMAFVGRSFSYEAWYQAVRRCWRFGQARAVEAHIVVAEGEDQIGRVIDRKADDHQRMKTAMAAAMKRATAERAAVRAPYEPKHKGRLPAWLSAA